MFYPIHTANLSAIKAIGRSDIFLILEIIKKICGLTILVASYFYFKSPIGIAYGALVSTVLCSFINASPNKKLLDYGYIEQILDVSPALLLAIPMGAVVYTINLIECPLLLQIFLQIFTGAITYFGLARLFKMERLDYLVKTVQEHRKRKKNG